MDGDKGLLATFIVIYPSKGFWSEWTQEFISSHLRFINEHCVLPIFRNSTCCVVSCAQMCVNILKWNISLLRRYHM